MFENCDNFNTNFVIILFFEVTSVLEDLYHVVEALSSPAPSSVLLFFLSLLLNASQIQLDACT